MKKLILIILTFGIFGLPTLVCSVDLNDSHQWYNQTALENEQQDHPSPFEDGDDFEREFEGEDFLISFEIQIPFSNPLGSSLHEPLWRYMPPFLDKHLRPPRA